MTMADGKCEVCGGPDPVAVVSTMIPYSCAYCIKCVNRQAQPELVFETWFESFDDGDGSIDEEYASVIFTFKDGQYINFKDWLEKRRVRK